MAAKRDDKVRKSIFITGAASGIGRESALLFAREPLGLAGQCRPLEEHAADLRADAEQVREVHVRERDDLVRVPVLPGHEEVPARPAHEDADHDRPDPQAEEAEEERGDRELALGPGVVAVPPGVRVDVRDHHQADDDEARQHDAGDPRIDHARVGSSKG